MGCGNSKKTQIPQKVSKGNEEKIGVNAFLGGKPSDYEIKEIIAIGRKSEIHFAIHKYTQENRAIKMYKLSNLVPSDLTKIKEEIKIISRLVTN